MKPADPCTPWKARLSRLLLLGYFVGMPLAVINPVLFDTTEPERFARAAEGPALGTPAHPLASCPALGPRAPSGDCPAGAPALDAPLWLYGALAPEMV